MDQLCDTLKQLQLCSTSALSMNPLEPDYILDLAVQSSSCSDRVLAATSSNYNIRLFSRETLASKGSILAHEDVITGVRFGKSETDLLYSSSLDKTIRCWDLRTNTKEPVQMFTSYDQMKSPLISFDLNIEDRVLCAGTESRKADDDVYILFWDRRKAEVMGCYTDSHRDDITQIAFHPTQPSRLASGSTDGLLCIFDISQTSEDDALLSTLNSLSAICRVGWCGADFGQIYCLTYINTYHVWDALEGDNLYEVMDFKETVAVKPDFLLDVVQYYSNESALLLAGSYEGDLSLVKFDGDTVQPVSRLAGGHSSTIRCLHWDSEAETLVTGGEDSLLCLWSSAKSPPSDRMKSIKMKVRSKGSSRKSRPYKTK